MSLRETLATNLDHCVENRLGMPRIDWERLFAMLDTEALQAPQTLPLLADLWLERLRDGGPPGGRIVTSPHFVAVAWRPQEVAERVLQSAERHRKGILRYLRKIARDLSPLQLPLLLFADYERYLDYTADGDPDDGEIATSGGMFVADGFPHVVLPNRSFEVEEVTLAHELTHAHLSHLDLPTWLNEGFATTLEDTLLGRGATLSSDAVKRHRGYWDESTIQGFWSGAGFRDPDGQELCYQLAKVLLRSLAKDYERLAQFAFSAQRDDAGNGAFQAVFRRGLETLPAGLLGPGPWQPVPWSW